MDVAFKRNDKWFLGTLVGPAVINKNTVTLLRVIYKRQVSKVDQIPDIDDYVHIEAHLLNVKSTVDYNEVLEEMKLDDLYVKVEKSNVRICADCNNDCKSPKVIGCNSFQKKAWQAGSENKTLTSRPFAIL